MPRSGNHKSGDGTAPRLTPTAVDQVSPFDSTTARQNLSVVGVVAPRETQLSSDPPTALVRRDSFRELPPGSVVGEIYEIDARLGAGAMGEVYAARHMKLGKRVAIKVIGRRLSEDAAAIERFAMEAKTLAQIQHPSIVAVEHVGELADGRAFFVMEFLRGEPLFERLRRGRVPLREALRILDQMARGLEAAHASGVTHRDLKPENTFLVHLPGEDPAIKLVDFGLSKLTADRAGDDQRTERTQSGVAIGTPMYMSPEQARGPDVDHRTDIYALGCVSYELLLGITPFPHARTAPELYAAHLHESPPLPRSIWPEIPPQLDLVLFAMLAKDPTHRPTLAQVRSVVADVRIATPSQRAATEFVGLRAPKAGTRASVIAVIALFALVGGITIGATVAGRTRGEEPRESIAPPAVPVAAPTEPPAPAHVTPSVPDVVIDPKPETPAPRLRGSGSGTRTNVSRQTPKAGSAAITPSVPTDAGGNAQVEEPTPAPPAVPEKTTVKPATPTPIDKNQIVNPFAKKRPR
jgi:serine/threonine-protein kinase